VLRSRHVNFSASSLFASLLVSSIGFVLLAYGRKQARLPQLVTGLALMIFPYFVPNAGATLGISAALLAVMWLAVRFGW
jgi:hypothetical protein